MKTKENKMDQNDIIASDIGSITSFFFGSYGFTIFFEPINFTNSMSSQNGYENRCERNPLS
jgi:hypothetical protein